MAQAVQDGDFAPGIREPWQELRDFIVQAKLAFFHEQINSGRREHLRDGGGGNTLSLLVGTPSSTLANP